MESIEKDADRLRCETSDKTTTESNMVTRVIDYYSGGDATFAQASWRFKLIALATALMLPVGSHFSGAALGAMKAPMKEHLGIDNTHYGVLSSAVSIINTVLPVVGGIFIDVFGSVWGTFAVNVCIITGSILTALAAHFASFPAMIIGRVVFGVGSNIIVTMQETLLSKWFRTQSLSIVIGIQLAVSQLASFLGTAVANPIAQQTHDWVWPFWLSVILCGFSIAMNIAYALMVRKLITGQDLTSKFDRKKKKTFEIQSVVKFPVLFWLVITIEFIYAAVWTSFQTISTELIQIRFGTTSVIAGYKASASVVVPIIATPLLGLVMDMFGFRICILLFSSIFLILSTSLLGWTDVDALVGMLLYSMSLAFGPIAMITSIGMILPSDYIGTGLGLYKASNNVGTSILDIVVGVVQDHTHGQAYGGVILLYLILAAIGFILICILLVSQRVSLANLLETGRQNRLQIMKRKYDNELDLICRGVGTLTNASLQPVGIFFLAAFACALVVAWVLFFVYAIGGAVSL
ncbi:major facilitator superfamily domain-containing protein [Dichotomocladium elegans]|nr:major facilitator superfamily domain-containing protein [Dichotomocladium elegans]